MVGLKGMACEALQNSLGEKTEVLLLSSLNQSHEPNI